LGNHLADRAAAGSLTTTSVYNYKDNYENHVYIPPLPSQDAPSFTSPLIPDNTWFFGTSDMQLRLPSLMDSINLRRLDQYLLARNQDRSLRSLPPKWHNRFIPLVVLLLDFSINPSSFAFLNRIMWDKHRRQGNQAKAVEDPKLNDIISRYPPCAWRQNRFITGTSSVTIPEPTVFAKTPSRRFVRSLLTWLLNTLLLVLTKYICYPLSFYGAWSRSSFRYLTRHMDLFSTRFLSSLTRYAIHY